MKKSVLLATVLIIGGCSTSASRVVLSKDYTCEALQQLIKDEGDVVLTGFLNSKAHVYSARESCRDVYDERPVRSSWKTSEGEWCAVGFICEQYWRERRG